VWEIKQRSLVDMAADRGAYIDQSQSLNIHMDQPNFGKLTSLHFHTWSKVIYMAGNCVCSHFHVKISFWKHLKSLAISDYHLTASPGAENWHVLLAITSSCRCNSVYCGFKWDQGKGVCPHQLRYHMQYCQENCR